MMNKTLEKDILKTFIDIKDYCYNTNCGTCRFNNKKDKCIIIETLHNLTNRTLPRYWELNEIRKDLVGK